MKIMCFFLKIFLIMMIISVSHSIESSNLKIGQEEPKYNALTAYPNYYEAPTMANQIESANFTVPWLSRSLFEEDPRRKLKMKEFLSTVRYTLYQLTRGEMEQIFIFADQNHDDLLDQQEWDAFTTLFVFPFEACDVKGEYILDEEAFKKCFDADPRSKEVKFRRRYEEKKYDLVASVVSTRGGKTLLNFSDYLFIRKALFAWKECHSNAKYISKSSFKCTLRIAIPHKYQLKVDYERIYNTGMKLANDPGLVQLDFVSYLRALYFTHVFAILGTPHDTPFLERTQFIKAIREDRIPMNFEESEINLLYNLIDTHPFQKNQIMNYESFAFFFNLHRLFNKYSIKKPLLLSDEELSNLLDDDLCSTLISLSVDISKTNFSQEQYLEVSMILQRLRINERDFYFSFKSKEQTKADLSKFDSESNSNTLLKTA